MLVSEIREPLSIDIHHALLFLVFRSHDSVVSILEELLFWINDIQNGHNVFLETMRINKEVAESTQVLQHFVDAIPDDQPHFISAA